MMKLFVLILAFAMAVCNGMAQKKDGVKTSVMKCTISGTLEKGTSVNEVSLLAQRGGNAKALETVQVRDGKFVLSTETDVAPAIYYIKVGTDEVTMFSDADDLKLQWNKDLKKYVVRGSAINNAYTEMLVEGNAYASTLNALQKEYRGASAERKKAIEEEYDAAEAQLVKIETKYLQANNNVLGLYILAKNMRSLDASRVEQYMEKLPSELKNHQYYKHIARYVESEKKCTPGDDYHDVALKTPEGKDAKISDYVKSDKYTILDFWASWCAPCRAEMPNMVKIYSKFADKGVEIIGISLDNDGAAWKKAIEDLGMKWPQISDLKGWRSKAAEIYGVQAIPMTVVIAPNGRIIKKNLRGEELYNAAKGWAK